MKHQVSARVAFAAAILSTACSVALAQSNPVGPVAVALRQDAGKSLGPAAVVVTYDVEVREDGKLVSKRTMRTSLGATATSVVTNHSTMPPGMHCHFVNAMGTVSTVDVAQEDGLALTLVPADLTTAPAGAQGGEVHTVIHAEMGKVSDGQTKEVGGCLVATGATHTDGWVGEATLRVGGDVVVPLGEHAAMTVKLAGIEDMSAHGPSTSH